MAYSFSAVILLTSAFLLLSQQYAFAGNDFQWGSVDRHDVILAKVTIRKPFVFGSVVTTEYIFTQTIADPVLICAIKVTDLRRRRGAVVQIVEGGVGTENVTLKFTSARGNGIEHLVEIFGPE